MSAAIILIAFGVGLMAVGADPKQSTEPLHAGALVIVIGIVLAVLLP